MTYLLQFTSAHNQQDKFFFCNLGDPWPKNLALRLIERTSPDRSQAREFVTEEDANACLVTAGSPRMRPAKGDERWGWEILEEKQ